MRGVMQATARVEPCKTTCPISWETCVSNLEVTLRSLEITGPSGDLLDTAVAFGRFMDATNAVRGGGRVIYLIGNGASASMASHFAADLAKNAYVHTQVFTDISLITAVANDLAFHQVFVEPLRRRMQPEDMLVCISSSGNSPNVVNAAAFAAANGGVVVTLTSMKPDNQLRALGALNFWVPADTYGLAETAHATILHYWMDSVSLVA